MSGAHKQALLDRMQGVNRSDSWPKNLPRVLGARIGLKQSVRLSWAAATRQGADVNLGDALSPIIVSVISGNHVIHAQFNAHTERLVAVGSIGQHMRNGIVHYWGTSVTDPNNRMDLGTTRYIAHATRGKFSSRVLREKGIDAPDIYGDPVWFMPRILPRKETDRAELGVVLHISELEAPSAASSFLKKYVCYETGSFAKDIRIINTFTKPGIDSMWEKMREITSCKRILSSSLHGLVIAEAYGIPCAWLGKVGGGERRVRLGEQEIVPVDHRVRDFYSGAGRDTIMIYCQDRSERTNWDDAINCLDRSWAPLEYDASAFLNAFPLPSVVSFADPVWKFDRGLLDGIRQ
jgi:hypothetical protein